MSEILAQRAGRYASQHGLRLAEQLGFGIHGIVYVVEDNFKPGQAAIKALYEPEPYLRERGVYERLRYAGVSEILGFHVPQLIRFDDTLQIIEMSIVTRPFVLDFAGAYLGTAPEFSEEIWADWETHREEQFEGHWPTVQAILAELEQLGIQMVDVSPSNIAFSR